MASTGELQEEVNRNLSLFLEVPTKVTVFALLGPISPYEFSVKTFLL